MTSVPAIAQEVRLTGKDGQLNITGTLLSVTGGKYVVRTALGNFEIDQELVNCEGPGCPTVRDITYDMNIAGAGEIADVLLPILADGFAANLDAEAILLDENGNPLENEGEDLLASAGGRVGLQLTSFDGDVLANFGIQEAEGDDAFEMLAEGKVSIVFSGETASRNAQSLIKEAGVGDLKAFEQQYVVAVDGFAVVTHPENDLPSISMADLARVFAGEITNWSQLGGEDVEINLYSFDSDNQAFHQIDELLLEPYDYELTDRANIIRSTRELTAIITQDEYGIGVIDYASKRGARAVPLANECGMVASPSPFSIKTEEYALQHRVYAYNRADADGYTKDFLDLIDGPDLDGLVSKAGFIDLSVTSDIQVDAKERLEAAMATNEDLYEQQLMQSLLEKMSEYERLSTTFRFAPGSNRLDVKARRDLARMVGYLADRRPTDIAIVGFTDNKGSFDANQFLSEERAQAIAKQIRSSAKNGELDGVNIEVAGFGPLSPVGCNTNPRGRGKNRRVEIWVR